MDQLNWRTFGCDNPKVTHLSG